VRQAPDLAWGVYGRQAHDGESAALMRELRNRLGYLRVF